MARTPIPPSHREGQTSRQAHADLPAGTFEREMGREGFFGPACLMYHTHAPTGWSRFEGPLRPRCYNLPKLGMNSPSPWSAPVVLHNRSTELRYWTCPGRMTALARNSDGDQLLFIHAGNGELFCDYGHLSIEAGDYVVLPRGCMWRLESNSPWQILMVEATNSAYQLPDRGLVGKHAIFDPAVLDPPTIDDAFLRQQGEQEWQVEIKRGGEISCATYPFNPLDAVGWHGDLCPVRLNLRDIRPLMSHRYHVPPSAHTTFVADRFVICSFVPRPFETDPGALKVPFFHNNDDYDEVLFYHAGNFFSRDNIGPGMMTFHPAGFTHGPHPKALTRMLVQPAPATEEYAVMIDTRDALLAGPATAACENTDYVNSWKGQSK